MTMRQQVARAVRRLAEAFWPLALLATAACVDGDPVKPSQLPSDTRCIYREEYWSTTSDQFYATMDSARYVCLPKGVR